MKRSFSLERQMGVLIGVIAGWIAYRQRTPFGAAMIGVAVLALALTVMRPRTFSSLTAAWMKLADSLGRVIGPVAMAVIYILVIVPVGVARRIAGADPLALRRDPGAASY